MAIGQDVERDFNGSNLDWSSFAFELSLFS